jgi:hypothetical protein
MEEWLVKLKGDLFDLQELPLLFISPEASVIEERGVYYLNSINFNPLSSAGDVLKSARYLLEVMNGAAILSLENFEPVQVANHVTGIDEEGKRHSFNFGYGTIRPSLKSPRKPNTIGNWLKKAKQNKNVENAFRYLCDQDWINLYKIFELVRDDVGNLYERNWVTQEELKRFTQTAQSQDTLGDAARHASKKYKPHPKPMSLIEAKAFIRNILLHWLNEQ